MSQDEAAEDREDGVDSGGKVADPGVLLARVTTRLSAQLGEPLAPGLYLVATPIGHLADLTVRAIAVLARADIVYCEDTRHSRTLLEAYGIGARLRPYHEHNGEAERPRVLAALADGKRVALISDAGTPLISDPGYKLVREAAAAGANVVSIPGPSAVLAALASAGLPTDTFFFAGFLPPRQAARRRRIAELAAMPATLIIFESPGRTAECLSDLASGLGDRPGVVARELTKRFEEIVRAPLATLAADPRLASPKGEIVILIGPPEKREQVVSEEEIRAALEEAMATASVRDAVRSVAEHLGVPKSRTYDLAVAVKRARDDGAEE